MVKFWMGGGQRIAGEHSDEGDDAVWCYRKKELPHGAIIIPLTIHYLYKRNQTGKIISYKARFAARGDKVIKYTLEPRRGK